MAASRSALQFLRRIGRVPTPAATSPRLDTDALRVNHLPLEEGQLNPALLLDANGSPPPDRGRTDPWPPPQEVTGDGSKQ